MTEKAVSRTARERRRHFQKALRMFCVGTKVQCMTALTWNIRETAPLIFNGGRLLPPVEPESSPRPIPICYEQNH